MEPELRKVEKVLLDAPSGSWWADEFDKAGQPDPTKWAHEEGYLRNREAQY